MRKLLQWLFLLFVLSTVPFITAGGGTRIIDDSTRIENIIEYYGTLSEVSRTVEEKDMIAYHNWDSIPIRLPLKVTLVKGISSDYGHRKHPVYGYMHKHLGIDLKSNCGTNVLSAADGVVEKVKKSRSGYGNQIMIRHSNGYKTRYAHLDEIFVVEGQSVELRTVIGTVGLTGLTTGPHLHYEVLKDNCQIDPMFIIKERTNYNYFMTMIALEKY